MLNLRVKHNNLRCRAKRLHIISAAPINIWGIQQCVGTSFFLPYIQSNTQARPLYLPDKTPFSKKNYFAIPKTFEQLKLSHNTEFSKENENNVSHLVLILQTESSFDVDADE